MHEVKIELGNRSELLIQPRERWVLWHITANCNIECDYCYGSFDGGSYKRDWVPGLELGTSRALAVASEIAAAGFDGVHINGGEPLLRDDCLPVAAKCAEAGLRTWLLTNGTVKARDVDRIASGDLGIEMLAFSFDSVDSSIADSQREKSRAARNTIERVTANASGAGPSVGVYVVLTAASLPGFPALVTWLRDIGVDYVNVQPCYLPESHPDGDRLGLRDEHRTAVVDAYAMLREMVPASTTAGMADLAAAAVGLRGIAHDPPCRHWRLRLHLAKRRSSGMSVEAWRRGHFLGEPDSRIVFRYRHSNGTHEREVSAPHHRLSRHVRNGSGPGPTR